MGVFLSVSLVVGTCICLPHARGGVSARRAEEREKALSSPRPWGCFWRKVHVNKRHGVFPTPVGVFLDINEFYTAPAQSSPRPWGCFCDETDSKCGKHVFPTPVGVFPARAGCRWHAGSLPHARGGVSVNPTSKGGCGVSSPRPWGCFSCKSTSFGRLRVFPTPVGVNRPRRPYMTGVFGRISKSYRPPTETEF